MRKITFAASIVLATGVGIASASLVSPGTAAEPLAGARDELPAATVRTGAPVADPRGGHPWAVRVYDDETSWRCIMVGRTDGEAFGPINASGSIDDTGDIASGSCADPGAEPLQLAVAHYADTAGTGPRSVLFGIADDSVARVELVTPGPQHVIALDASRMFVVPREEPVKGEDVTVTITLSDGTLKTYRL